MSRHTQKLIVVLALVTVLVPTWHAWWGLPLAHAEPFTVPAGTDTAIATLVTRIITALNLMTWVLFTFLNYLLDPIFIFDLDSVSGEDASLMIMLNRIWQLSRDLVNLVFAVALIGSAVYTIVTSDKEFLNTHAQKFVLAVILVNFSWFIPRLILDASSVLAATIYSIPSELSPGGAGEAPSCTFKSSTRSKPWCTGGPPLDPPIYTCECGLVLDAQFLLKPEQANNLRSAGGYNCLLGNLMCYKEVKMSDRSAVAGYSAILNGLVINHGRLVELATVPAPIGADRIDQLLMFIVREVLILVIHVALFFPLLAMTVAFLIRIPILWITIAFMPFYFLTYVGAEKFGGEGLKQIMDTFLKMAFLPAIVAVPLAIGFIMINAGAELDLQAINRIPIHIFDGISNFGQLLWLVLSLGVIWVGVFKALEKGGEFIAGATRSIQETGKSVGRIAVKAPLAAAPIPSVGMTPLALMKQLSPRNIESMISGKEGISGFLKGFKNGPDAERKGVVDKLKIDGDFRTRVQTAIQGGDPRAIVESLKAAGYTTVNEGNLAEKLKELDAELKRGGNGLAERGGGGRITQADIDRITRRAGPAPAPAPAPGGGGAPPAP